ncbi:tyrosine-type recombinase/integrase [Fulvivirga sp. 29W222]|uniref:Tyrosine-type recombinase/integrase n=1 Tax=Fulvivirga marina TaxID=2494733 RepID=A0A937KBV1_9BACT|nr:site-specific integrase [Fulvivirga marina]MBL6446762.1 tyrosine-type recombinase/integrase [Fulvivirga marina]
MRKLPLQTPAFRYLEKSYGQWLDILGYAPSTVKTFPTYIREFLHYMEKNGYTQINQIDIPMIKTYYQALSQRSHQRQGGSLSNNYLNAHLNAIDRLLEYLRKQARIEIPPSGIPKETPNPETITPLTLAQVKKLYQAADLRVEAQEETYHRSDRPALALRDKALLAVFYDCGLRRTEGENLNLSDLHYDSRLLEVRKGKGGKPRFVPLNQSAANHLQNYHYEGRPVLMRTGTEDAFFLNYKGQRAGGNLLNNRLKALQHYSGDTTLQQMPLHLHVLRHSIATHLLYHGMSLEHVSRFLGHASLESTQVYTHLVEQSFGEG